jgi:hypothetical protein
VTQLHAFQTLAIDKSNIVTIFLVCLLTVFFRCDPTENRELLLADGPRRTIKKSFRKFLTEYRSDNRSDQSQTYIKSISAMVAENKHSLEVR